MQKHELFHFYLLVYGFSSAVRGTAFQWPSRQKRSFQGEMPSFIVVAALHFSLLGGLLG
jgi:hypothetical protein